MATIAELIERARRKSGANQSQIGVRLNRSRQTITNWKSGERVPDDGEVIALARMAGEDPEAWLAIAQAARTEGAARKHWESIAKRLGIAAAFALCVIGATYAFDSQDIGVASLSLMFAVLAIGAIAGTVLVRPGRSPIGGSYA